MIITAPASQAHCQTDAVHEYDLKATFLFKLVKFVEWPEASLRDAGKNFVICILGDDPFGEMIDRYRGRELFGKILEIRRAATLSDTAGCQVLFVSLSESEKLSSVLTTVKSLPVLTVGDSELFCRRGGIVNFVLKNNKISFEINVNAAESAGLKIRSKLLRLSTIVETGN